MKHRGAAWLFICGILAAGCNPPGRPAVLDPAPQTDFAVQDLQSSVHGTSPGVGSSEELVQAAATPASVVVYPYPEDPSQIYVCPSDVILYEAQPGEQEGLATMNEIQRQAGGPAAIWITSLQAIVGGPGESSSVPAGTVACELDPDPYSDGEDMPPCGCQLLDCEQSDDPICQQAPEEPRPQPTGESGGIATGL